MGIFQKIIEGFRPSMTAEEENAVRSKIAEFDLAVHRMTGRYISLEEACAVHSFRCSNQRGINRGICCRYIPVMVYSSDYSSESVQNCLSRYSFRC